MQAPDPNKPRAIVAGLETALAQIRLWRETQGENAPDRSSGQMDDELLEVCERLVSGILVFIGQSTDGESVQNIAGFDFVGVQARVADAQFRAASAHIAQIEEEARVLREKVGDRILQKCFPKYGEFFALFRDAVPMTERAQRSPEKRPQLLRWSAQHLREFIALHNQLLACEKAAVAEKWREARNIALGIAVPLLVAVLAAVLTG